MFGFMWYSRCCLIDFSSLNFIWQHFEKRTKKKGMNTIWGAQPVMNNDGDEFPYLDIAIGNVMLFKIVQLSVLQ